MTRCRIYERDVAAATKRGVTRTREGWFPRPRLGGQDLREYDQLMMNDFTKLREVTACDLFAGLEFDDFRLFPRRRVLMRGDEVMRLGARGFDLLTLLALRTGEVVPYGELIKQAWPIHVVSDCNLKVQIGSVQKTLGEAPFGGRYIKCVALRGYVFVADVRPCSWIAMNHRATTRRTHSATATVPFGNGAFGERAELLC